MRCNAPAAPVACKLDKARHTRLNRREKNQTQGAAPGAGTSRADGKNDG